MDGYTVKVAANWLTVRPSWTAIATIRVSANFGDSETDEGSVAQVMSGTVTKDKALYVAE